MIISYRILLFCFLVILNVCDAKNPSVRRERFLTAIKNGQRPFSMLGDRRMTMGSKNAPIKITIYVSIFCPHCDRVFQEIVPSLQGYVKRGKIQLKFKLYVTQEKFSFHGALFSLCIFEKSKSDLGQILSNALKHKEELLRTNSDDVINLLTRMLPNNMMTKTDLLACGQNEKIINYLINTRLDGEADGVSVTPTFIIKTPKRMFKHEGMIQLKVLLNMCGLK